MDAGKTATKVTSFTRRLRSSFGDRGASLVEYAMLVALIAVVCLGAIRAFGNENDGLVQGSADDIVNASGS